MDDTVAGLHVEGHNLGGGLAAWIEFPLLVFWNGHAGSDIVAQGSAVLAVGHFDEVVPGNARKIILVEGLFGDGMEEQELGKDVSIDVEGLDVMGGKMQKCVVVGGKESPGTGGQGIRESGHIEVVAKDGEVGVFANESVCRKKHKTKRESKYKKRKKVLRRENIISFRERRPALSTAVTLSHLPMVLQGTGFLAFETVGAADGGSVGEITVPVGATIASFGGMPSFSG